ncbi:hypothetical protein B0O99DRAFT_722629 [Bisporella sp. PMI_857]|nr:hypothetical protein B0O99DRAFT_722629 [Bisporella sp. PMI_857]
MTPSTRGEIKLCVLLLLPHFWPWPFIFSCHDIEKMAAHQQPFLQSRKVEWLGELISILSSFYYVEFLDDLWRGTTASFSPSTLGYDNMSSWQMFTFLNDLGPLYAIWILESCRVGNTYTLAYFPTIFAFAGQLLEIRTIAPFAALLLPLILAFHTLHIFLAYLSSDPTSRHYWAWAWKMSLLWVGISNFFVSKALKKSSLRSWYIASPQFLLTILGLISASTWAYMLVFSPHSLPTIFIPHAEAQSEFVPHMRRALPSDEIFAFGSSFVWIGYQLYDLYSTGLAGNDWIYVILILPIITVCIGQALA